MKRYQLSLSMYGFSFLERRSVCVVCTESKQKYEKFIIPDSEVQSHRGKNYAISHRIYQVRRPYLLNRCSQQISTKICFKHFIHCYGGSSKGLCFFIRIFIVYAYIVDWYMPRDKILITLLIRNYDFFMQLYGC